MYIIAYDLGTGGVKAALYDEALKAVSKSFIEYPIYFPSDGFHEQRPGDWWNGIKESTLSLISRTGIDTDLIGAVSISGQSLTGIPVDSAGRCLQESVPIWTDQRAKAEAQEFFSVVDQKHWYETTGNGFPAYLYTIFKMMWLKKHFPDIYSQTAYFLGSKDFINFRMTGNIMTDYSYASGTGGYNLRSGRYEKAFWDAAGLDMDKLPPIVSSDTCVGTLLTDAARQLSLSEKTKVFCGGVDNACMALGATGVTDGAAYVSLGSSSWIPVTSSAPVIDYATKPYVFAHIDESMYTSAYSIFAGGSSLRWARDTLFSDFNENAYARIDRLAMQSPAGSNGVLFNPTLAGGTSQDKSENIKGGFAGITLSTTRSDLARSVLEGIALNLRQSLTLLKKRVPVSETIQFCGGGSRSRVWLQLFADIFNCRVVKTNIDQDTASLGAAAIAAKGCRLISSYDVIKTLHHIETECVPDQEAVRIYDGIFSNFQSLSDYLADFGDCIAT